MSSTAHGPSFTRSLDVAAETRVAEAEAEAAELESAT
jgi:hypothetical protein